MSGLQTALILAFVLMAGFLIWVRLAPSNPDLWHVDPLVASKPKTPNAFLLTPDSPRRPAPEFEMSAAALAAAFDQRALSDDRVTRLAGGPEDLFVTYIARSKLLRYPDYVSVRFIPLGENRATLAVFSRARFGYGDRGVNKARILRWLKSLGA
jgi:hypothetical protein